MKIPKSIYYLCAALLVLALAPMPYGYYTFLRLVVTIVACITAFSFYKEGHVTWAWIFGLVGILFNPLIQVHLSRDIWMILDLLAAGLMLKASKINIGKV
jgi:hypothetical protein